MPGGCGDAFVIAKLQIIQYARINNVPFLGICLGFQLAIVEFSRNVLGLAAATSEEFDPCSTSLVVRKAKEACQVDPEADLYLGPYEVEYCGTGKQIYGSLRRLQHFKHRYILNVEHMQALEGLGLKFCAKASENRVSMAVLEGHPFFVGVQYHPEILLPSAPPVDPIFEALLASIASSRKKYQLK